MDLHAPIEIRDQDDRIVGFFEGDVRIAGRGFSLIGYDAEPADDPAAMFRTYGPRPKAHRVDFTFDTARVSRAGGTYRVLRIANADRHWVGKIVGTRTFGPMRMN